MLKQCGWNFFFFFFNDTATTEIYTLSLHDALPISYMSESLLERRICFIISFPPSISHVLAYSHLTLVSDNLTNGQTSISVSVMGNIKFSTKTPTSTPFSQTFILTTQASSAGGASWKIARDCFRMIE